MKATKFRDQNTTFAENQKEYLPLPALMLKGDEGHVITCWKMSFKEKLRVLFTGKIWLSMITFGRPLTPVAMMTNKKELYTLEKEESIKNEWILYEGCDEADFGKAAGNNCHVKFGDGSECRYKDTWSGAILTHYKHVK